MCWHHHFVFYKFVLVFLLKFVFPILLGLKVLPWFPELVGRWPWLPLLFWKFFASNWLPFFEGEKQVTLVMIFLRFSVEQSSSRLRNASYLPSLLWSSSKLIISLTAVASSLNWGPTRLRVWVMRYWSRKVLQLKPIYQQDIRLLVVNLDWWGWAVLLTPWFLRMKD